MRRNAEIGQGCRTVFLPTVASLTEWWVQMRGQYPVMAYYRPGMTMLPSCRDDNEECEWVAGPSVEAVVGQMLLHLGLSVQAAWTGGHWDGAEWIDGWWSIPELNDCPLTEAARLYVSDRSMDSVAASNAMLRQLALRDQDVVGVYVGSQMDGFIADEVVARDDQLRDGGTDFYGHRNEGRKPQPKRVRKNSEGEIKERTNLIRESMLALKNLKHADANCVATDEVIFELERLLDKARARMLEPLPSGGRDGFSCGRLWERF